MAPLGWHSRLTVSMILCHVTYDHPSPWSAVHGSGARLTCLAAAFRLCQLRMNRLRRSVQGGTLSTTIFILFIFDNWFMDEGGCLRACYVASAEPADAMLSHPFDGSTSLPCDNVRVRVTLLEWSILIFGLAYVPLPLSALCSLRRGSRMWSLGRRYSQILRDACHRSG